MPTCLRRRATSPPSYASAGTSSSTTRARCDDAGSRADGHGRRLSWRPAARLLAGSEPAAAAHEAAAGAAGATEAGRTPAAARPTAHPAAQRTAEDVADDDPADHRAHIGVSAAVPTGVSALRGLQIGVGQ